MSHFHLLFSIVLLCSTKTQRFSTHNPLVPTLKSCDRSVMLELWESLDVMTARHHLYLGAQTLFSWNCPVLFSIASQTPRCCIVPVSCVWDWSSLGNRFNEARKMIHMERTKLFWWISRVIPHSYPLNSSNAHSSLSCQVGLEYSNT